MDKIAITPPFRPVVGGTNNGTRPRRYAYWRTGYGERKPNNLEFWIAQAGEYHSQATDFTGDFEHTKRQQFYYHIAGEGVLKQAVEEISVRRGDMLIIPPQTNFIYQAQTNIQYHWFGLEGTCPAVGRYADITRLPLGYDSRLVDIFESIREILILQQPGYALQAIGIFYELLAVLEMHQTATSTISSYPDPLRIALTYIQEHYQEPFEATKIAAAAGISPSHLRHLFHKWVGESPLQSQIRQRITVAKRLFHTQNLSVTEVAHQVGYQDPLYFSRVFKKNAGVRPSEFIRSIR